MMAEALNMLWGWLVLLAFTGAVGGVVIALIRVGQFVIGGIGFLIAHAMADEREV